MSEIDQQEQADPDSETDIEVEAPRRAVRRKPSPTPFDHPLSFPLMMGVLGLWFGYDWLFNPKIQSKTFNQVMFWICLVVFALTLRIGLREMRIIRERKAKKAAAEAQESASDAAESN